MHLCGTDPSTTPHRTTAASVQQAAGSRQHCIQTGERAGACAVTLREPAQARDAPHHQHADGQESLEDQQADLGVGARGQQKGHRVVEVAEPTADRG